MRIRIIGAVIALFAKFWFDCAVATVITRGDLAGVGTCLTRFAVELFAQITLLMQSRLQDTVATCTNSPATFGGTRIAVASIKRTVIALFAGIECAIATAWQFAQLTGDSTVTVW